MCSQINQLINDVVAALLTTVGVGCLVAIIVVCLVILVFVHCVFVASRFFVLVVGFVLIINDFIFVIVR